MFQRLTEPALKSIRCFMEKYRAASPATRRTYLKTSDEAISEGRNALRAWLEEMWEQSWGLRSLCGRYCKERGLTLYGLATDDGVCRKVPASGG